MQMYSCSRLEAQEPRIRPAEDRMPPRMMVTLQESQFPRKPPRGAANTVCTDFCVKLLTDNYILIFTLFSPEITKPLFYNILYYYYYYRIFFCSINFGHKRTSLR